MALTPIQQRLAEIRAQNKQVVPVVSGTSVSSAPKVDIKTRLAQIRASSQPKSIEQQRQERISQGLPVSVNKDKVAPTMAGGLVRGLIKAPASVLLSVPATFRGEKGVRVRSDYMGETTDLATNINDTADALAARVNSGEISKGRAIAGVIGNAALRTADVASIVPVEGLASSASKNIISAVAPKLIKPAVKGLVEAAGTSLLRGGGTAAIYDVGQQLADGGKYDPLQTAKAVALGSVVDFGLTNGVPAAISKGKKVAFNNFTSAGRNIKNTNRVIDELKNVENGYEKLRKNQKFSVDANDASRKRVVSTGVLNNAVDETGTIRTEKAIENYKAMSPINKTENVVRQNLERLGETVDPSVVEKELVQSVYASGLEGADLRNALNTVKKEVAGYRLKADPRTGRIPLTLVHDAKISTTKGINFQTPPEIKTYRKAVASGLKTTVENNSSFNVKQVNDELAPHLQTIKYLESLDGRKVQGGKLGKYTAQIAGNIAGGAAGGVLGGLPGSAVGTIVGGEVAGALKGRSLSRTLGGVVGKDLPESKILKKAVATAKSPQLALPAPRDEFRSVVGSGPVINLPAPEKVYKSPRIALQPQKTIIPIKKPTKIGITKVSTLPKPKATRLSTVVKKSMLETAFDNLKNPGKRQGGFIRLPESGVDYSKIARNIDNTDKNIILSIVDEKAKTGKLSTVSLERLQKLADSMNLKNRFGTANSIIKELETIIELERQNIKKKFNLK